MRRRATSVTRRDYLRAGTLGLAAALAGCSAPTEFGNRKTPQSNDGPSSDRVDDWQFDPSKARRGDGASGRSSGGSAGSSGGSASASAESAGASAGDASLGFAAGGAKDVNNFRENIEQDYLPLPTDVSYEGLFYDYYFDTGTGASGSCEALFCPTYSTAVTEDPFSGTAERYLTVGLNSGLDASAFERKALNLVVVLDISGSMGSGFDEYYYDRFGNRQSVETETNRSKMDIATRSVAALTTHLSAGDRFGMVLYNDESYVAKPLRAVERTDMDAIRGHIQELEAGGGTRLSGGLDDATELLAPETDSDPTAYETRMIVLTDAMPNLGTTSEGGLKARLASNAEDGLYTTFIGMGVDFHTEIVDAITSVRGANYYSVHSASQFERRLDDEFEYMVTPLVFDLSLELDATGYDVESAYGTTAAAETTGELVHANTLFPSPKREGRTRGGVILVKLRETAASGDQRVTLETSWETRTGESQSASTVIRASEDTTPAFDNTGIRKAVLLTRYANLLKNWTIAERTSQEENTAAAESTALESPPDEYPLGQWERQSTPLTVSPTYRDRFSSFAGHFEAEMDAIGDDRLSQELDVLRRLAGHRQ